MPSFMNAINLESRYEHHHHHFFFIFLDLLVRKMIEETLKKIIINQGDHQKKREKSRMGIQGKRKN